MEEAVAVAVGSITESIACFKKTLTTLTYKPE